MLLEGVVDSIFKIHPILTIPHHLHRRLSWITPLVFSWSLCLLLPPLSFTVARVIFSNIIYTKSLSLQGSSNSLPLFVLRSKPLIMTYRPIRLTFPCSPSSSPATHYLAHSTLARPSSTLFLEQSTFPPALLPFVRAIALVWHTPLELYVACCLTLFSSLLKCHLFPHKYLLPSAILLNTCLLACFSCPFKET